MSQNKIGLNNSNALMAYIGKYILVVNKAKPFSRISTKNRNPDSGAQQRYDGKKDYNELLFVKKDLTDDFVDLVQSNKGEKGVEEYLKKNPLKESIKLEEYGSIRSTDTILQEKSLNIFEHLLNDSFDDEEKHLISGVLESVIDAINTAEKSSMREINNILRKAIAQIN